MKSTAELPKKLIIDADSLAYRYAVVNEEEFDFGDDEVTIKTTDLENAIEELEAKLELILEDTETEEYQLFLTGSGNFRYDVLPTYKHNRKDLVRPELLTALKGYLINEWGALIIDGIEADDACTIMMSKYPNEYVLAHIDKDLNQAVGWHYNWNTEDYYYISEDEAERFFYMQVLAGDSTDGYSGCPTIGMTKAAALLDKPIIKEPYEHTLKSGKRKGQTEIRYRDVPTDDIWRCIVSHYEWKGLTEEDALQQARVAFMLTDEFYNDETKEVILWQPKKNK